MKLLLKSFIHCRDGCAGTANYKISGNNQYLHVMWSSPNNFDKHASHLAIGDWSATNSDLLFITETTRDQLREMRQVQWYVLPETLMVRQEVCVSRCVRSLVPEPWAPHSCQVNYEVKRNGRDCCDGKYLALALLTINCLGRSEIVEIVSFKLAHT